LSFKFDTLFFIESASDLINWKPNNP